MEIGARAGLHRQVPLAIVRRLKTGVPPTHASFRALEDCRDPVGLPAGGAAEHPQPDSARGVPGLVPGAAGQSRPRPAGRVVPAARGRPQHGGARTPGQHGGWRAHAAARGQYPLCEPGFGPGQPAHGAARDRYRAGAGRGGGAARIVEPHHRLDRAERAGYRGDDRPGRHRDRDADRGRAARQGEFGGGAIHRDRAPARRRDRRGRGVDRPPGAKPHPGDAAGCRGPQPDQGPARPHGAHDLPPGG